MDNNSTTPLSKAALEQLMIWSQAANPSSQKYELGRVASASLEDARKKIARCLNVPPTELYFTSGATEANNLAIQGVVRSYSNKHAGKKGHIVCSALEHKAALEVCKELERRGHVVTYVFPGPPRSSGRVLGSTLQHAIRPDTCLIVVMHANNELGTIQDVWGIGKVAKARGIPFHCDCAQSAGRTVGGVKPQSWGATSISVSAHKFGGPKGVGCVWISKKCDCLPLSMGGEQEKGMRPGTENMGGIMAMAAALQNSLANRQQKNAKLRAMCQMILREFEENRLRFQLLGTPQWGPEMRLPNTMLVTFLRSPAKPNKAVCNSKIVAYLDGCRPPIAVSIGSACNTKSRYASHVLDAIEATQEQKQGAIRISLGDHNTPRQCRHLVYRVKEALQDQGIVY